VFIEGIGEINMQKVEKIGEGEVKKKD